MKIWKILLKLPTFVRFLFVGLVMVDVQSVDIGARASDHGHFGRYGCQGCDTGGFAGDAMHVIT